MTIRARAGLPEVALVGREFHPFGGGGIGSYMNALARTLTPIAQVTVLTTSRHEALYRELVAARDERLPPEVRFVFVPEPQEPRSFYSLFHGYSARVYETLLRTFPDGGPDLAEFPDYLGEGFVSLQAARTGAAGLRRTRIVVRLHTSMEMCALLDGDLGSRYAVEITRELERFSLRRADWLLWGGGDILATYQRVYGERGLAPARRVRHPLALDGSPGGGDRELPPEEGPLRLLYIGRLERRKGVHDLVRAVTGIPNEDWRLTLVGGDTETGPLGLSMRSQLELAAAADARITIQDSVPRTEIAALIRAHHATVMPSRWECWPGVALESLSLDRPVIASPTGGLVEMVRPGETGWLTEDRDPEAIAATVEHILGHRGEVTRMITSGALSRRARRLTDPDQVRRDYEALLAPLERAGPRAPARRPSRPPARRPLVSVVVPYFKLDEHVEQAVESIFLQTWPRLEVIIVNDGAFADADGVLASIATRRPVRVLTQVNRGLGAARNTGISQARGAYVLPFDADNLAAPELVERGVGALEADRELAYVTCWSQFVDEDGRDYPAAGWGYEPLGNQAELLAKRNVAGDAAAILRRRVFDLGFRYSEDIHSYEDWFLYRQLAEAGWLGMVVPERLVRYRVRPDSMMNEVGLPRETRLIEELEAQTRERMVRWTSKSV